MSDESYKIVILGGGFGGVYAAIELEKLCRRRTNVEITLVNEDNFLLFTPMLHEVVACDLEPSTIVTPIHTLLKRAKFFCGRVDAVDLERQKVTVSHGAVAHTHILDYDHLVLALGSVTHFFNIPGIAENAVTMRSLRDAIELRNRMIGMLEEADFECCKEQRSTLLTFVVAGGGFAGVETAAAMQDFLHESIRHYANLVLSDIRIVLVNSGEVVLPELDSKLGRYTGSVLESRGMEIRYQTKVGGYDGSTVTLTTGESFKAGTIVWTAGNTAHPITQTLSVSKEKGKILVDKYLKVPKLIGVWALGDCAAVPTDEPGKYHPPTAQHATRQARLLARNIVASLDGEPLREFRFEMLGQLASLGRRRGVAQILGFRFSGFIAWVLWRTIYLIKLPRLERRIRVALEWTLDLFTLKDIVQLPTEVRQVTVASTTRVSDS